MTTSTFLRTECHEYGLPCAYVNSAAILFHQLQISLRLPNVSACRLQSSKRETSSFVVSLLPCLRDPSSRSISETRLVPRGEVVGLRVSAVSLGSFRLPAIVEDNGLFSVLASFLSCV